MVRLIQALGPRIPVTGERNDQERWWNRNQAKAPRFMPLRDGRSRTRPPGIVNPRRCDCSICRRKGAVVASVPLSGIKILQGEASLKLYQFNTKTAKHYFCSHCGIYSHHQRRSNPDQYGYNVGCLEGVNPFDLGPVPTNDGVNHPAERKV
jgi:hypothetical protein